MLSEISIGLTRNPTIHLNHCLTNAREKSNADFFQSDLQFLARTRSQKPLVIAIYRPVKNAIWNLTSAFAKGLPPMTLTRVVLADDNEELLADICQELENEFRIVATVTNGRKAVDSVQHLDPDVVVLDITMPSLDEIQTSSRIRENNARAHILILTIQEDGEYVSAAFSSGYATKRRLLSDLAPAIRELAEGRTFLSPTLRHRSGHDTVGQDR